MKTLSKSVLLIVIIWGLAFLNCGESKKTEDKTSSKTEKTGDKIIKTEKINKIEKKAPNKKQLKANGDAKALEFETQFFWAGDDLSLVLKVKGDDAVRTVAYGMLNVATVTDDTGTALKEDGGFKFYNLRDRMKLRDRSFAGTRSYGFDFNDIKFASLTKPLSSLKIVEGSFLIRATERTEKVVIPDIEKHIGSSLSHPLIKEAGITVEISKEEKYLVVKQTGGELGALEYAEILDSEGKKISTNRSTDDNGPLPIFRVGLKDGKLTGLGLGLNINLKMNVLKGNFKLENLEVPAK